MNFWSLFNYFWEDMQFHSNYVIMQTISQGSQYFYKLKHKDIYLTEMFMELINFLLFSE